MRRGHRLAPNGQIMCQGIASCAIHVNRDNAHAHLVLGRHPRWLLCSLSASAAWSGAVVSRRPLCIRRLAVRSRRRHPKKHLETLPPHVDALSSTTTDKAGKISVHELSDAAVDPAEGHAHAFTLVYLHGYSRYGAEYLPEGELSYCMPWVSEGDRVRGLRTVLPTARRLKQPWGDNMTSWYRYSEPHDNRVGDLNSLVIMRLRLRRIVRREVARLGGDGGRVFLGGASQGCTAALDTYLRVAPQLQLGGFVGSIGFMPSDKLGFVGSDEALRKLCNSEEQAQKPIWIQCATDDRAVPWWSIADVKRKRKLPGLLVREVSGRGHGIGDWEAHIVNDFFRHYFPDAVK